LVCTVLLAWKGYGYWSLVYSHVLGTFVGAALVYYWRVHPFAVPHFRRLREEILFSAHVLTSAIGSYWYTNADFLVAGKMLGQVPLGNYTVAWTISSAPVDKVTDLVTGITPAYFSAIQNDNAELRRYLLRLTEALSYITLPLSLGVALLADYFVPVVLGSKWTGVVPSLRLLVLFVAFRSIATLLPRVLTAIGDARFVMIVTSFSSILLPFSFVLGSHWNAPGIAAAWMLVFPFTTVPLFHRLFQRIELKTGAYLSSITPAAVSSLIMTLFVIVARFAIPAAWSMTLRLSIAIAVGVVSYTASVWLFYRERVMKYVTFYSSFKR
jgi:teichuronic acid exporter